MQLLRRQSALAQSAAALVVSLMWVVVLTLSVLLVLSVLVHCWVVVVLTASPWVVWQQLPVL